MVCMETFRGPQLIDILQNRLLPAAGFLMVTTSWLGRLTKEKTWQQLTSQSLNTLSSSLGVSLCLIFIAWMMKLQNHVMPYYCHSAVQFSPWVNILWYCCRCWRPGVCLGSRLRSWGNRTAAPLWFLCEHVSHAADTHSAHRGGGAHHPLSASGKTCGCTESTVMWSTIMEREKDTDWVGVFTVSSLWFCSGPL